MEEALDILSRQPATAHHVCQQLATYFVSDTPPAALVQRMAATFITTDGDTAEVLRTMFRSPEFKASLGAKFKDPMHYVVSAVRLPYPDRIVTNPQPMQSWLDRLGESPFNHETPGGYSMTSAAWNGPGQMDTRFEIAHALGASSAGLFKSDPPGAPPSPQPPAPALQQAVNPDGVSDTLATSTKTVLTKADSPQVFNALFLSSPDFMRR